MNGNNITRRGLLSAAAAAPAILHAQNRGEPVRLGIIGLGGISRGHIKELLGLQDKAKIVAVCDIYKPRLDWGMTVTKAKGYHDYRDLIADRNVDAVLVLTPDHWHSQMAIDAMRAGKDVDVEKPMALTVDQAREMVRVAKDTGRVLAVDSEHTAHGIWAPAHEAVAKGLLGKLLWSQTSRSRNQVELPWEYAIDADASPRNLDWKAFLGSASDRPFDKERFFRWRRYWEYSGGLVTDLFIHHITPLMIVAGPEFPMRAATSGGAWHYEPAANWEVPDTVIAAWDYPSKHTLLCAGSLANSAEMPIVMRGHEGNIFFHGPDQRRPDYFVLEPEAPYVDGFVEKVRASGLEGRWIHDTKSNAPSFAQLSPERQQAWIAGVLGEPDVKGEYDQQVMRRPSLASDAKERTAWFQRLYDSRNKRASARPRYRVEARPGPTFMERFLRSVHTRETPVFDGRLGYMTQVAVSMAVDSWRKNKIMFFDPKREVFTDGPAG